MKLAFATIGTVAALMTSTAAMAETESKVAGPRGDQAAVEASDGQTEYSSTAGASASPATDYRTDGVREETEFGSDMNANGPRGGAMETSSGADVVIIEGDNPADPNTNGPRGEAQMIDKTDGQAEYSSTTGESASPATDYRTDGVREETVYSDEPETDASAPRGG